MRINGYKCDDCGNVHNDTSLGQGWIRLQQMVKDNAEKYLHFCSLGCLRAWAIKQAMEQL